MRKLLAFIMTVMMAVTLMPASAMAEEEPSENAVTWRVEGETLYLEGRGEVAEYDSSNSAPWSESNSEIKEVVMDEGITGIGAGAIANTAAKYAFYKGTEEQWKSVLVNDSKLQDIVNNGRIHYSMDTHDWGEWYSCSEWYSLKETECLGGDICRTCRVCDKRETKHLEGTGHHYVAYVDGWDGSVWTPECSNCDAVYQGGESEEDDKFFGNCEGYCDYGDPTCDGYFRAVVSLSGTSFTANGETHKPKATVYICDYSVESWEEDEWGDPVNLKYGISSKHKLPEKYYDITYSGDGVKAGKYKVTVKFKDAYSGTLSKYYNVYASPIISTKIDMYKGKTKTVKRSDAKGTIKWKSSNKKVATVSSSGKVKAKKYGTCKIYATYRGKTYSSKLVIPHHKPSYEAVFYDYRTRSGKVYVWVENKGQAPLYVYSSGSKLIDFDYKCYDRNLKLYGGKKYIKIKPGKSKDIVYKIRGGATWPGVDDKKIRMKFKYEGKKYTRYAY